MVEKAKKRPRLKGGLPSKTTDSTLPEGTPQKKLGLPESAATEKLPGPKITSSMALGRKGNNRFGGRSKAGDNRQPFQPLQASFSMNPWQIKQAKTGLPRTHAHIHKPYPLPPPSPLPLRAGFPSLLFSQKAKRCPRPPIRGPFPLGCHPLASLCEDRTQLPVNQISCNACVRYLLSVELAAKRANPVLSKPRPPERPRLLLVAGCEPRIRIRSKGASPRSTFWSSHLTVQLGSSIRGIIIPTQAEIGVKLGFIPASLGFPWWMEKSRLPPHPSRERPSLGRGPRRRH